MFVFINTHVIVAIWLDIAGCYRKRLNILEIVVFMEIYFFYRSNFGNVIYNIRNQIISLPKCRNQIKTWQKQFLLVDNLIRLKTQVQSSLIFILPIQYIFVFVYRYIKYTYVNITQQIGISFFIILYVLITNF